MLSCEKSFLRVCHVQARCLEEGGLRGKGKRMKEEAGKKAKGEMP